MTDCWYHRSHLTDLSDDELLILDVMFSARIPMGMLRGAHFATRLNSWPHSLSDRELLGVVSKLADWGIISPTGERGRRGDPILAMTRFGGEQWSRERCPVWDRYCEDTYPYSDRQRDREALTVISPSSRTRDDFLRVMAPENARLKTAAITNVKGTLLPQWRSFALVHVGLATYPRSLKLMSAWAKRWESIERRRTWWRDVHELQRFVGDQKNNLRSRRF